MGRKTKKIIAAFQALVILSSVLALTGCSYLKEAREGEVGGLTIYTDEHDFLDDYESAILDALSSGSKGDIKSLFAGKIKNNNEDLDVGLEYIFGLADWSDCVVTDDNVSSYREYGGEYEGSGYDQIAKNLYVNCKMDVSAGDKNYRILFGGFGNYAVKVKHSEQYIPEMMGLGYLRIYELDEEGNMIRDNDSSQWLDGVYYPERSDIEMIADMLLKNEGRTIDGSWTVDTSEEAALDRINRYFDEDALEGFDEDELAGLVILMTRDDLAKKLWRSYYVTDNGSTCLVLFFHLTLKSRCLVLEIDEGKITGATLGYENEYGSLHAEYGKLTGFAELAQ